MKTVFFTSSDSLAMVGEGFSYKYSDFPSRMKVVETALASDAKHAAIFAENSPEWIFTCYGIWASGGVTVPIDAKNSADELAFILNDSDSSTLFCDAQKVDVARAAIEKIEEAKRPKLIILQELFSQENLASNPSEITELAKEIDDLAFIVYTSGTTGNPKGVMLSFKNLHANIDAVTEERYYFKGMRVLAMLPFHHILPLMGTVVAPISVQGKIVFPKSLSPDDMGAILAKYSVDMIISVPRFYDILHANIMGKISRSKIAKLLFGISKLVGNLAFSNKIFSAIHKRFGGEVKFWISGGAPLDKTVWRDLKTLGFNVCEGFGMTEAAPIITFPRIGKVRIGSTGQALPNVEIRITDGEIAIRGDNVTSGYYKRPEETAESIRNGWLYTGDLGTMDEDGYLYITGRRKEIIVLPNGKNVDPSEIESQIRRMNTDEILEVGVLMYQNLLQAIIKISPLVERKFEKCEDLEEYIRNSIILPYNRNSATYKRIIRFAVTKEELPRTRVGKLKRFHLASYLENIGNERPSLPPRDEPETQTYAELKEFLASQISLPVDADAHMEMDLGLDSLGKISTQCFVRENYSVEVSEKDFEQYSSLRTFSELVESRAPKSPETAERKTVTWADIIKNPPFPKIQGAHFFHFATIIISRTILKLGYKIEIEGLENLPAEGAVIVAPNHQSYLDGLFVSYGFTKTQIYKTFFFAKVRGIIRKGFIRWFARRSNVIIMDINDNVSESIRKLASALRKGNRIMVFPEGTRTRDGAVAEFKQMFAILAKEMGVPVAPVAISGAYEALKPGATFPNWGAKVKLSFMPLENVGENETYEEFSARMREKIIGEVERLKTTK